MLGEIPSSEVLLEVSDQKESRFRDAVKGYVQLVPGVERWIKRFKDWGRKQAIASSAPRENIDALVDELEIRSYFDAIVSGFDLPGKPDPAVFLKTAARVGMSIPSSSVVGKRFITYFPCIMPCVYNATGNTISRLITNKLFAFVNSL